MRSRVILFAVLIVVAFQVVVFVTRIPQAGEVKGLRVIALPFYRGGLIVYRFFRAQLTLLREKEALIAENKRLREELGKAQGENVLLRESLEHLKMEVEAVKIERYFSFEVIPAQVIGWDPYDWLGMVVIDRGREEGVSEGLAVVTYQGMVGRVERVYPHYAEVQLLLSPSLALGVLIQRTRDLGVLMGDGQGLCVVQYVSRLSQVQEGDVVITSGLGGKIPRGVVVGRVREVKEGDGDLFKEIVVEPTCDFSLLGRVFVIQ